MPIPPFAFDGWFPFCVAQLTSAQLDEALETLDARGGITTAYIRGLSLQEAWKLFWLKKKLTCSYSGSYEVANPAGGDPITKTYSGTADLNWQAPVSRVCGAPGASFDTPEPPAPSEGERWLRIHGNIVIIDPLVKLEGVDFLPTAVTHESDDDTYTVFFFALVGVELLFYNSGSWEHLSFGVAETVAASGTADFSTTVFAVAGNVDFRTIGSSMPSPSFTFSGEEDYTP